MSSPKGPLHINHLIRIEYNNACQKCFWKREIWKLSGDMMDDASSVEGEEAEDEYLQWRLEGPGTKQHTDTTERGKIEKLNIDMEYKQTAQKNYTHCI